MNINRFKLFLFAVLVSAFCGDAFAAIAGTNDWEKGLSFIAKSLTGPIAYGASSVAIVLGMISFLFSENLNTFGLWVLRTCLGVGILMFITQFMTSVWGIGSTFTATIEVKQFAVILAVAVMPLVMGYVQRKLFSIVRRGRSEAALTTA